jgi:hypothetical protein
MGDLQGAMSCDICYFGMEGFDYLLRSGVTFDAAEKIAIEICSKYVMT